MSLEMTFIYLVCGTCALIMFCLAFFIAVIFATSLIDAKIGKAFKPKPAEPLPKRKVVGGNVEPKRVVEKERIESIGLKIYVGE